MRIAVTGATGFLGSTLCARLSEAGHGVLALVRREPGANFPYAYRIVGDLAQVEVLPEWFDGVDAVVHLAAKVHVPVRRNVADEVRSSYFRSNVDSTRRLAEAARAAGAKRFIYLSSSKVNGETSPLAPWREDMAPQPLDAYGESKWAAERTLAEIGRRTGLETIALRSPLVYGPGVKANFLRLLSTVQRGYPIPVSGEASCRRSFVFSKNLVDAIFRFLEAPVVESGAYYVSDAEITTRELVTTLALHMQRRPRFIPISTALSTKLAVIPKLGGMLKRLTSPMEVDSGKIRRVLAWNPPYTWQSGLKETVDWYLQQSSR